MLPLFPVFALDLWAMNIPTTAALALVALLGYVFGQRTRQVRMVVGAEQARRELKRANKIARELEEIAGTIRRDIAVHHTSIARFKERLRELGSGDSGASWQELCEEAELVLSPTLKLTSQISNAYDQIRQHSNQLMTFTEARSDPLTGICNRRAMEETLESMFAMYHRYDRSFSIAIFDIDHFKRINDEKGHLQGDKALQDVARVFDETVRETDILARFGGEEFVVIMPYTPLAEACAFGNRLRQAVEEEMALTVSGGAAEVAHGDTPQLLLARADAALYGAKADGRNRFYGHDGHEIGLNSEGVVLGAVS